MGEGGEPEPSRVRFKKVEFADGLEEDIEEWHRLVERQAVVNEELAEIKKQEAEEEAQLKLRKAERAARTQRLERISKEGEEVQAEI